MASKIVSPPDLEEVAQLDEIHPAVRCSQDLFDCKHGSRFWQHYEDVSCRRVCSRQLSQCCGEPHFFAMNSKASTDEPIHRDPVWPLAYQLSVFQAKHHQWPHRASAQTKEA